MCELLPSSRQQKSAVGTAAAQHRPNPLEVQDLSMMRVLALLGPQDAGANRKTRDFPRNKGEENLMIYLLLYLSIWQKAKKLAQISPAPL